MAQVTGRGSIIPQEKPERKCKKWQLRVSVGRDPITKEYRTKTKRFEGTKTQAQKELRAFINELESGIRTDTMNITFEEYAEHWYELQEKTGEVARGTLRKYDYHIRAINRYIGYVRLLDLDRTTIQSLYIALRNEGALSGKPLAGTTVHHIAATLIHILSDAEESDIILKSPCRKKDKPRTDTKEKTALTVSEARALTKKLTEGKPDAHSVGILLALTCGLRRGEVLGLRWCDFDEKTGIIHIVNTLPSDGKVLKEPKSKAGKRNIPLDSLTFKRLKEWRSVQAVELLAIGLGQDATRPIITSNIGGYMHPANFARWWGKNNKRLGANVSLHQLRHTFATLLVANGVDIVTAKTLMGHSDTKMLTELYAHVVPENVSKATELIGGILYGEDEAAPVIESGITRTA